MYSQSSSQPLANFSLLCYALVNASSDRNITQYIAVYTARIIGASNRRDFTSAI